MKSTGRNSGRGKRRKVSARSLSNLRPWQPGQSGNPNGRPVKPDCLTDCLRELAGLPDGPGGATRAQRLAGVLWGKALRGDVRAIALLLDRLDGKAAQSLRVDSGSVLTFADFVRQVRPEAGLTVAEMIHQANQRPSADGQQTGLQGP